MKDFIFIVVVIASLLFFFTLGQKSKGIHISGRITGTGFLYSKKKVEISFNGYPVINGILDESNNGQLHGTFNNQIATASCSGAETVSCLIKHPDLDEYLLTFNQTK